MKIIARETRPLCDRLIVEGPITREVGEKWLADLSSDPKVKNVLGREYRLVEDDYKLIDRLDLLTRH
jgi:hypothetical protein